jgi:hypothetical protein
MELIVVPGDGLVRAGGRLAVVLGKTHSAMMLSKSDFAISAEPPDSIGVLMLGDDVVPAELAADPRHEELGALWGFRRNTAWISHHAATDPDATLDMIAVAVSEIQQAATRALEPLGPLPDPAQMTGEHLSGVFLDPKLRVPAQTVAGGGFSFTPERMCWERQYTLGIVHFLAHGFDSWAGGFSG